MSPPKRRPAGRRAGGTAKTNRHADIKTSPGGVSGVEISALKVLLGRGVTEPKGVPRAVTWPELVALISAAAKAESSQTKTGGAWFSCAQYKDDYRKRENICSKVYAICADLDEVLDPEGVKAALAKWTYVGYTTWSSTPENPKWRIVFPVEGGVEPEKFAALVDKVLAPLRPFANVDPRSRLPEQLWFFPTKTKSPTVWTNSGLWVRRLLSVDFTGVPRIGRPEDLAEGDGRNNALHRHLGGADALRCKTEQDLLDIALSHNARFAQPLDKREVRSIVRSRWRWMTEGDGLQRRATARQGIGGEPGEWEALISGWQPKTPAQLVAVPPIEFVLYEWIQRGLAGEIVAEGGTGKTTVLIDLGVSIALGGEWLGLRVERAGTFALLSLDDPQDDLDAVLALVIAARELTREQIELVRKRVRLISLRGHDVVFARGGERTNVAERIARVLEGIDDLRLVVLDTLRQFSGGDSSDDRAMVMAAQAVTLIADRLRAASIVPHHVGKAQSRSGVDDMYVGLGSTAIADSLRFVLRLERVSFDAAAEALHVPKDYVVEGDILRLSSKRGSLRVRMPEPIYFTRSGYRFERITWKAKTDKDRLLSELSRVAAAIMGAGGRLSRDKAIENVSGQRTRRLGKISSMVTNGWLATHPSGTGLVVTDGGRTALAEGVGKGANT